jgi:peptide/nickel transport system ATP-binding protein/oligopeptide transport system ATP-binding protein
MPLLDVTGLTVHFRSSDGGIVKAVDGIDFSIPEGKTLGLVGESGSGKTTAGRALIKLAPAKSGVANYRGTNLLSLTEKEFRPIRRGIQMIFQDPFGSLNPRMNAGQILREPLDLHFSSKPSAERQERAAELMEKVGLDGAWLGRFPHEFSGGQRQRLGIARALACEPRLIICDEPVSALDVSVQAQVVNLLQDLQEELGLTYLFIAHDLAVVQHMSDEVAVMYHGKVVERGSAWQIYEAPEHDYTRRLLAAVPEAPAPVR